MKLNIASESTRIHYRTKIMKNTEFKQKQVANRESKNEKALYTEPWHKYRLFWRDQQNKQKTKSKRNQNNKYPKISKNIPNFKK